MYAYYQEMDKLLELTEKTDSLVSPSCQAFFCFV